MGINTRIGNKYDYFKNLTIPEECYFVVRLDGNCFSSYTKQFKRPFDDDFNKLLTDSSKYLMEKIPDIFMIYLHSDEVSCFFKQNSDWFKRRVEKIVSITSGMMSARFTNLAGDIYGAAHFDSRILVTPTHNDIRLYLKDRIDNAYRTCINSYVFYSLVPEMGEVVSTRLLENMSIEDRHELLFTKFNINPSKIDIKYRKGSLLTWEEYEKEGFNPILKQKVTTTRRKIIISHDIAYAETHYGLDA